MLSVDRLYRLESLFKYGRFLAKLPLKFSICSRRSAVPAECCGISKKNKTPRFQNCTWRVYLASLSSNSYCTAVAVPVCLNVFEQTLECHHSNERYSVSNSIKRYSWFVNAALNLTSWSSIDLTIKFAHKVSRKLMLRSILLIYLPIGFQTASNLIIKLAQKARSKFMLLHFSWYTHLKQPGKKNKTKQNKQTHGFNYSISLPCSHVFPSDKSFTPVGHAHEWLRAFNRHRQLHPPFEDELHGFWPVKTVDDQWNVSNCGKHLHNYFDSLQICELSWFN